MIAPKKIKTSKYWYIYTLTIEIEEDIFRRLSNKPDLEYVLLRNISDERRATKEINSYLIVLKFTKEKRKDYIETLFTSSQIDALTQLTLDNQIEYIKGLSDSIQPLEYIKRTEY